MEAILFIVGSLWSLYLGIFALRFVMQLVRANFRNPAADAIVKLTNPLLLPLRRVLPPIGKIDTASIVALIIVQAAAIATMWLLGGYFIPNAGAFVYIVFLTLLITVIRFYIFALILYAILSWIAPGTYSPAAALLDSLCEPLLRPIRRIIPPLGGIDLSALFVIILLQALHIAIT